MATTHIHLTNTELANRIRAYRNALTLVISEGPLLLAKFDTMIDGGDYSELETEAGFDTGDGTNFYSNHQAVVLALQANPATAGSTADNAALLATKLSQYVSRVG